MKKILLLFVLFLGFSFGAFAANEIESVDASVRLGWSDQPVIMVVYRADGTVDIIRDGGPCNETWVEDEDGIAHYKGEICP